MSGVAARAAGKQFDRDLTVEPGVVRPIHLAHAPGTFERKDVIGAEVLPEVLPELLPEVQACLPLKGARL